MQPKKRQKINIEEKYLNELKNVTMDEGSLADIVYKWWLPKKLSDMTPSNIYTSIHKIIPEDELENDKVKSLFKMLQDSDNVEYSITFVGNFILRESKDGFIKHIMNQ